MRDPFDLLDRLLNRQPKPDAKKSAKVEGIERVLTHLQQVPKGWRLDGEWYGQYDGDLACHCFLAVRVTLEKFVEDWPKPRQMAQRYVCAGCGLGVEAANKRFADCVSAAFADRLGVTPPAPTLTPEQEQAKRNAETAAQYQRLIAQMTQTGPLLGSLLPSQLSGMLAAKGGGDK